MKRRKFVLLSAAFLEQIQPEFFKRPIFGKSNIFKAVKYSGCCLFVLALVSLFLLAHPNSSLAKTQKAKSSQKQSIRVGILPYYPIVFEKNGVPTGFHFELLQDVAKKEGWVLDYKFSGSFKNVLKGLESGSLDLGMGLVPTADGKKILDYTSEENALLKGQVFVHSDRNDMSLLKDLNDKKVAYVIKDALGKNFIQICDKLGVYPVLKRTNSYDDLSAAVISGDVDAGIFSHLQGERYASVYSGIKATPIVFKPMEVQFAVLKGQNQHIIETLDRHIRKLKMTEKSLYYELKDEFLTEASDRKKEMPVRDLLIGLCLCLLFILFGIMVGDGMAKKNENIEEEYSRSYLRDVIVFAISIGVAFWIIDSLILWFVFNDKQKLTLLELAITRIPPQHIYVRGMFFLMCCFFAMFFTKYIRKYEVMYSLMNLSVDRFERLTDNAKDVIFHMSLPNGEYGFVNKAAADIFGYSPDKFYKSPLFIKDLIHPDSKEYFSKEWDKLLNGKIPKDYEYQIVHRSGEVRWVNQRNTVYFDEAGAPSALEGIVTDITKRKSAEIKKANGFDGENNLKN